jgi:RNA polymerase sigma factor (sigma-70 family)
MESDKELVARIRAGDESGFRSFVARYQRLVAHVVARTVRDPADREEVCQDVFMRVYRGIGTFNFDAKLSTWIARIAYRTSLNHLERKRLPLYDDLPDAARPPLEPRSDAPDPLENLATGEVKACVHDAVDALPTRYRMVVTLYHLEELSIEEVGSVMDLPAGTVKSHLFRARRLLKDALLSRGSGEEIAR